MFKFASLNLVLLLTLSFATPLYADVVPPGPCELSKAGDACKVSGVDGKCEDASGTLVCNTGASNTNTTSTSGDTSKSTGAVPPNDTKDSGGDDDSCSHTSSGAMAPMASLLGGLFLVGFLRRRKKTA